jgi:hypothetical protein
MGTGIPGISIFEVIFHRPSLKREPANEKETKIKKIARNIVRIRPFFLHIRFLL